MRKIKIISIVSFLLVFNHNSWASASNLLEMTDGLMFKPAITVEYQDSFIGGKGQNGNFKPDSAFDQIKKFDNIVLGANLRVHRYLGFNLNWSKSGEQNNGLNGLVLSKKASLNLNNINATTVLYYPIIGNRLLETFAEIGVGNIGSQLKFTESDGISSTKKSTENVLLYGAGIQFSPYLLDLSFRLGVQKYHSNLGMLNSDITTLRAGVIIPF